MNFKNLGRTGVKVSPLCLGTMNFGDGADDAEAQRIVDRALEAGLNFVDSADVYAGGEAERMTGRVLKGRRENVILASKVHGKMGDDPNMAGNSRRHIIEGCEASLKRLGTDYLDVYQLHHPQSDVPLDESLRALDDLVHQGKVRYIGTSNFPSWQVVESLWTSERLHLNRVISEQPPYNLLDRRVERELLPMAQSWGVAVLAWGPLAGGLLSGKYRHGSSPAGSRYDGTTFRGGRVIPPAAWRVIEGVEELARDKGVAMDAFALAWTLLHPGVTSAIIGPRTLEQLEANLRALEVEITEQEQACVDELIAPGTHAAAYYESGFAAHAAR